MAGNPEYQFSKLNDILCTSFNNVKHDVREINTKLENLGQNIANLSSDSIKTAFEEQTRLILEQQKAVNQLNERLFELEQKPAHQIRHVVEEKPEASMVFPTRENALSEIRKIMKAEKKAKEEPVTNRMEAARKIRSRCRVEGSTCGLECISRRAYG